MSTTTSIRASGRLLTCAALALGLTGLSATVARAHDDGSDGTTTRTVINDFPFFERSPCTNEDVEGQGRLVIVEKTNSSGGKTTIKFTSQHSGNATGVTTDDPYKFSNSTENVTRTTACKFTMRFEIVKKIIRVDCPEWRNDDFFLTQSETLKIDSCRLVTASQSRLKSRCK